VLAHLLLACGLTACAADSPAPANDPGEAGPATSGVVPVSTTAVADPLEFTTLYQLWTEQRYAEALPLLKHYRANAPYGRNELVDYLIATSACRVAGQEALGRQMYAWILDRYSLEQASRDSIMVELQRCPPAAQLVPIHLALDGAGPATSSTRGKMFYDITRGGELPMQNEPVKVLRAIPPAELSSRLLAPDRASEAAAMVHRLVGEDYQVVVEGPFVLASGGHPEAAMREIGRGLTQYLEFFVRAYDIPRPPHLVTVYLAAGGEELRRIAERVHGIGISSMSIGYSFRDDLSMVGIIPGTTYGTLAHELFHLMVRRDFGDVPPWLDEGMAALFEVSRAQPDGSIRGIPNWRGPVLRQFWDQRPALAELVSADWRAFEAEQQDWDPVRQAVNHATARYLVLYLQDTGRLHEVLTAFRSRDALAVRGTPAEDAVLTLERAVGKPVAELDGEFAAWFQALPR